MEGRKMRGYHAHTPRKFYRGSRNVASIATLDRVPHLSRSPRDHQFSLRAFSTAAPLRRVALSPPLDHPNEFDGKKGDKNNFLRA